MKLTEITKIVQQPSPGFSFDDFNIVKQIGTAENIPLFRLEHKKDTEYQGYALQKDGQFVSAMVGRWGTLDGDAFFIERTYTVPSERNKGLITSLYQALYRKYKIRLISDIKQSPETISVWKKLAGVLPVKVIDTENKKILSLKDVSDEQLYDPELGLRLVLERFIPDPTFCIIPEPTDGILEDYINYTHIINEGKFV